MIGFVLLQLSDALPQLSLSILPRHNSTAGSLRRRQDSTVSSRVYGDIKEMELYVNGTYMLDTSVIGTVSGPKPSSELLSGLYDDQLCALGIPNPPRRGYAKTFLFPLWMDDG